MLYIKKINSYHTDLTKMVSFITFKFCVISKHVQGPPLNYHCQMRLKSNGFKLSANFENQICDKPFSPKLTSLEVF